MKSLIKYIAIAVCTMLPAIIFAQNGGMNVGSINVSTSVEVGDGSIDVIVLSELVSLPPLSNSDIEALGMVPEGSIVYSNASDVLLVFDGSSWKRIDGQNDNYFTPCDKEFQDQEGHIFNGISIGMQCWMDKNVNIGVRIDGNTDQENNSTIEKYCYDDSESNCDTFGGLYQWNEAMNWNSSELQGICPNGWHVPTDEEWTTLTTWLTNNGHSGAEGTSLKSTSGWYSGGNGTDDYDFSALPGGQLDHLGGFSFYIKYCYLWSSTENVNDYSWNRYLGYSYGTIGRGASSFSLGHSLRCIKDN